MWFEKKTGMNFFSFANFQLKKEQNFWINRTIFYVTSTVCLTHFNHCMLSLWMLSVEWQEMNIFKTKIITKRWTMDHLK